MADLFSSTHWTFTQGFILGQASFLIILLLFIRYIVFSSNEASNREDWRKRRAERASRAPTNTFTSPSPLILLQKTSYDMSTHAAESSDWLNVLLAQVLQGYRNDLLSEGGEDGARARVERWLNPGGEKLGWLDPIEVNSISLGGSFPLLSNARIRPSDGQGHLRAEIDVDYIDSMSMSLSTAILVNFPRPRFAVLPVSLGVELLSLGGTMSVTLHEPVNDRQHIHVCLLPDFHLNLKTTSLLGSRAKLQDIPKLEQLILSRLRMLIQDRFVHPNHISLALPRILTPSLSPTPILEDIGEGAVDAMRGAVTEGVKRMVEDFMGETSAGRDYKEDTLPELSAHQEPPSVQSPELSSYRPSYVYSYTHPAPLTEDKTQPQRPSIHPTQSYSQQQYPSKNPPLTLFSSYHQQPSHLAQFEGQGREYVKQSAASSIAPSQSQSQFRFRGQFASPANPTASSLTDGRSTGRVG
ncbi:uncharacterized protein L203_105651 [Cryptococcus depauperatus CBS 7841]|uniref:Maintenance of mitochondrial morphology protein 1 n=1 Tax=Cryptococcus depauperatus CBS 7841 TaxID=1295531 RepID=A0A1E3IFQ2_9TREE|nr:mitochondrial outer membrane protein [Cryptococcus depauperatus CBS 7841]